MEIGKSKALRILAVMLAVLIGTTSTAFTVASQWGNSSSAAETQRITFMGNGNTGPEFVDDTLEDGSTALVPKDWQEQDIDSDPVVLRAANTMFVKQFCDFEHWTMDAVNFGTGDEEEDVEPAPIPNPVIFGDGESVPLSAFDGYWTDILNENFEPTGGQEVTLVAQWKWHNDEDELLVEISSPTHPAGRAQIGDNVTFDIKVTNKSDKEMTNVRLDSTELRISGEKIADTIAAGESVTVNRVYGVLTEDDLGDNMMEVFASIIADIDGGCGKETGAHEADQVTYTGSKMLQLAADAEITAQKEAFFNGEPITELEDPQVGDEIDYVITVTNTGALSVDSIEIEDIIGNDLEHQQQLAVTFDDDRRSLAHGESLTAHASYTLDNDDIGQGLIVNTAFATANAQGEPISATKAEATVNWPINASMTFEKTADVSTANVKDTVNYTFTVTNTGTAPLSHIVLEDPMLGIEGAVIAETLAGGETTTFTADPYMVTVEDAAEETLSNTAYLTAERPDGEELYEESTCDIFITSHPSLSVSHTVSPSKLEAPQVGQTLDYEVTVYNDGDFDIENLNLEGVLSNGGYIEFEDYDNNLAVGHTLTVHGTYALQDADLDLLRIESTINVNGVLTDTGDTINITSETVPVVVGSSYALALKMTADRTEASIGDTINYAVTLTNTGRGTLTDVHLVCPITGEDRIVAASLASGESIDVTMTHKVDETDVANKGVDCIAHATATAGEETVSTGNVSLFTTVGAIVQTSALTMGVTASPEQISQASVGDVVNITYHMENTGSSALSNVKLQTSVNGQSATASVPSTSIAAGGTLDATGTYTITQTDIDRGRINIAASAAGVDEAGQDIRSAEIPAVVNISRHPSVATTIKADIDEAEIGDIINYTMTAVNNGDVTLTNVCIDAPQLGIRNSMVAATLAPGATATLEGSYKVVSLDAVNGTVRTDVTVTAAAPSGLGEVTDKQTSATPIKGGGGVPSIYLASSVNTPVLDNPHAGDIVKFEFSVSNTGNIVIGGITLPSFMNGGKVFPLQFPMTELAAGEKHTFTQDYILTQEDIDCGSVSNTTSVSGTAGGSPVRGNTSSVTVQLTRHATASVNMTANVSSVTVGDKIDYTIVIRNTGNTTLSNIKVNDTLLGMDNKEVAATLLPNASIEVTGSYTATAIDKIAGKVVNNATITANPPSGLSAVRLTSSTDVIVEDEGGTQPTPTDASMALTIFSTPSSLASAKVGDTVTWNFVVRNTGKSTINNLTVEIFDKTRASNMVSLDKTSISAGETAQGTSSYTLTQADIDNGSISVRAVAHGKSVAGDVSDDVSSPTSNGSVSIDRKPSISVSKTVSADKAQVGDELIYTTIVTNTGNTTLADVSLDDTVIGVQNIGTLVPGASKTFTGKLVLAKEHVGTLTSTATAKGTVPGQSAPVQNTAAVSTQVTDIDEPVPPVPTSSVTISMTADKTDISSAKVGDKITYQVTISNTGDTLLGNFKIASSLTGAAVSTLTGEMSAGKSITAPISYLITDADIKAGKVINEVYVTATCDGKTVQSNKVSVTTTLKAAGGSVKPPVDPEKPGNTNTEKPGNTNEPAVPSNPSTPDDANPTVPDTGNNGDNNGGNGMATGNGTGVGADNAGTQYNGANAGSGSASGAITQTGDAGYISGLIAITLLLNAAAGSAILFARRRNK